MKIGWISFCFLLLVSTASAAENCTHGKLFISDTNSTKLRVYDVSKGISANMAVEQTITVPGGDGINLEVTGSGEEVTTVYRGTEAAGYTDGVVNFYSTGYSKTSQGSIEYGDVTLITNAEIKCSRAIHYVKHDGKIAIFCDGSYDINPNNTTVWVVDESKFGSTTESAIVFNTTLLGSHHGVAIPVDDNHVLYSLATPDRIARAPNGTQYALPSTFQVVDYEGNILHSITDESSKDTSCSGFHGSSGSGNTFALACDDDHGGILVVDYNPTSSTYKSRALSYPSGYVEHRTGSFTEHPMADYFVGNFAGNNSYHLLAFETSDTVFTTNQILTLPDRQCAFAFEQTNGEAVMVLMPNGMFHVFEYHDDKWEELAKIQVVEGMTACTEAIFAPGFGQAFVIHKAGQMLYSLDIGHVGHGEIEVETTQLDYLAFAAVVAAPTSAACAFDPHHEHGDEKQNGGESSAPKYVSVLVWTIVAALVSIVAYY